MGILDQFRKNKEEGREHTTPPPPGHTVAEILQDKNNSHFFGSLLERDGQGELATRVATGKLEQDDIDLLAEYRTEFSEKIAQSEKIERLLTEENVIEIARNHPDFAKIIDIVGPQKAIKVIRGQLREICFNNEGRFNAIAEPIEALDSFKNGEYKKTNNKVEKFCKDNLITQQEYLDALAIEDPVEKEKALKKLSSRTYGGFNKAVNILSLGKWAKDTTLQGLKDSETSLEDSVAELDGYKSNIGNVLFLSLSRNGDMRNALSGELLSESVPATESKNGFTDAKSEAVAFNDAEFSNAWAAFKVEMDYDSFAGDSHYDREREEVKDMFIHKQQDMYRKKRVGGGGFWASIFATLFEGKINSKRNTLK